MKFLLRVPREELRRGCKPPWYYFYLWDENYALIRTYGLIFFDLFIGMWHELKQAFRELYPNMNIRFFRDRDYWWEGLGETQAEVVMLSS